MGAPQEDYPSRKWTGLTKNVLDHGYLTLLDYLGTDQYLVDTARVSTGSKGKSLALLRRLIADKHSSPVEFAVVQFEIKAPLFVFREWHRHRTQSYSELSARFGELPMDFYVPTLERMNPQHATNKQMSDESKVIGDSQQAQQRWKNVLGEIIRQVDYFRQDWPLTRELAQRLYPQNRYTICRASGNLWNWFLFLNLRTREDAQYEIRQYANEIVEILKLLFPVATEAYEEYMRYAVTFSRSEMVLLKAFITGANMNPLSSDLMNLTSKIRSYGI